MSGPKRNADKLNTIGIVVVGICGAVLVYVTIVALQAFYAGDTSEVQTLADYGGNDEAARTLRTAQITTITTSAPNGAVADPSRQTYRIKVDEAMKLVVQNANPKNACPDFATCGNPGQPVCPPCAQNLVPLVAPSTTASAKAIFGRPQPIVAPAGAGSAAPPAPPVNEGAGSGSGAVTPPPPTAEKTGQGGGQVAQPPAAGSGGPAGQKGPALGTGSGSGATTQRPPVPAATGSGATPPVAPPKTPPAAGSGSAKGNGR